eukprot:COSAG01_NODE_3494_length_6009_cov_20.673435_1_plen_1632_part_10
MYAFSACGSLTCSCCAPLLPPPSSAVNCNIFNCDDKDCGTTCRKVLGRDQVEVAPDGPTVYGHVKDAKGETFECDLKKGVKYYLWTNIGKSKGHIGDTVLTLMDKDAKTVLKRNDDGPQGKKNSYLEYTPVKNIDDATIKVTPKTRADRGSFQMWLTTKKPTCLGIKDCKGVCDGTTDNDCSGKCGGTAKVDVCGKCKGTQKDPKKCTVAPRKDCAGVPGGKAKKDVCGKCGGDGSTCKKDCAGVPGGSKKKDKCGVCGGNGATCGKDSACIKGYSPSTGKTVGGKFTTPIVTQTGYSKYGATFRLYVKLKGGANSLYTIVGTKNGALTLPPAFQSKKPNGAAMADFGGVDPLMWTSFGQSTAQFDSWLTVGPEFDNTKKLSAVGFSFTKWTSSSGLSCSNCAVVWMDPTKAPKSTGPTLVAQITVAVPCSKGWSATMGMAGGQKGGSWRDNQVSFAWTAVSTTPPKGCDGVANSGKINDACGKCGGDGKSCAPKDCAGVPFGTKVKDVCGKCGGDGKSCLGCDGKPNSGKVKDACGHCGGNGKGCADCAGVPNGGKKNDKCGVCGGDGKSCADCAGVPNGKAKKDKCGKCDADPTNDCKKDCAGQWGGPKKLDKCGVCGGNGATCGDKCVRGYKASIKKSVSGAHVTPTVLQTGYSTYGATFRLYGKLKNGATSLYTIVGTKSGALTMPPAFQSPKGSVNFGGADPDYWKMFKQPATQFDSWITVGLEYDSKKQTSATAGFPFSTWGASKGMSCDNCAVVWMSPDAAPKGNTPMLVAQLTLAVPCTQGWSATMGMAGKMKDGTTWRNDNIGWAWSKSSTTPPKGCDGIANSGKIKDSCGKCGGDGSSCAPKDCAGVPGGSAKKDVCGVCKGNGKSCLGCDGKPNSGKKKDACGVCGGNGKSCADCAGVPNGKAKKDRCGKCDADPTNDCTQDCKGVWGGKAKKDACGVCGGNGQGCVGCDGKPNSGATKDKCGKCDADPTNDCKKDCRGVWGGKAKKDKCGVCGGDGSTCTCKSKGGKYVNPGVDQMCASKDGKSSTYRLYVTLKGNARNLFTIFGSTWTTLSLPPAFQVPSQGANVGGVDPLYTTAKYDSWLTIGMTAGDPKKQLAVAGLNFPAWTSKFGLKSNNGAVFFMSPDQGPTGTGKIVVAQITTDKTFRGTAVMGMSGQMKSALPGSAWRDENIVFGINCPGPKPACVKPTPPPTPPTPPPTGSCPTYKPTQTTVKGGARTTVSVVQTGSSKYGATFRLYATLKGGATSLHAVAGTQGSPIVLPPAFQASKGGSDFGGVDPDMWKTFGVAEAEFDSWLTIGTAYDKTKGALGSRGVPFSAWTASKGVTTSNGAVFLMDPTKGPKGKVLVAQVTVAVPCSKGWTAQMMLIGKTASKAEWRDYVTFGWSKFSTGPTPPPTPPPPTGSCPTYKPTQTTVKGGARSTVSVVQTGSSKYGATFRLYATLKGGASIYSVAGTQGTPLVLPPAFQASKGGSDFGGADPDMWKTFGVAEAEFDSWLTVGYAYDKTKGALGSRGVPFSAWTASKGITTSNGAVFLMDPTKGPKGKVLVAQVTVAVPCSKGWTAQMMLIGKTASKAEWRDYVTFGWSKFSTGPTPPPTPPPPTGSCPTYKPTQTTVKGGARSTV